MLDQAQERKQFGDCLRLLMAERGHSVDSVERLSHRAGKGISRSTASNLIIGKTATERSLRGFLFGCGLLEQEHGPWLVKRQRIYPGQADVPQTAASSRWIMSAEARGHFTHRARGHRSGLAGTDLFRGREAALAQVCAWWTAARSPGRPLVVTGQPGGGKSALLGHAVLRLEAVHVGRGAAVHARGLNEAEVRKAIAPLADLRDVHSTTELLHALSGEGGPSLLLAVDALDEAATDTDRRAIADLLVGLAHLPRLRVVVATRPLGGRERHAPGTLLYSLGASSAAGANLIDLDADTYFDAAGLRAFAAAVLTQGLPGGSWSSYQTDPALTGRLATAIGERAGSNYLVAALAATELGWRDRTVDPADPEFEPTVIPSTVGEAITKYLDAVPTSQRAMTRALLTALAYARGDGIDERRWVEFAEALGYPVTRMHVQDLRQSPASAYLEHHETDDGDRTIRLFHQALNDELLRQQDDPHRDERALLSTLLPATDGGRGWADADAYRRTHAADHAEAAGMLPVLLNDPRFLTVADLDRLLSLLPAHPPPEVAPIAAVLRQATDARWRSPRRRGRLFALSAAHLGLCQLQASMGALSTDRLRVGWAHSLGNPHQVIGGHTGEGVVVSIGRFAGRTVVVSGDAKGAVQLTDAVNGCLLAELPGHPGGVDAVAVGNIGGRDVVVTAGSGQVRIADTLTSSSLLVSGHGPLALGRIGELDVVVVGDDAGLLVHDPVSDRLVYRVADELPTDAAVTIGRVGTRDVIAYSARSGVVLLDGRDGTTINELSCDVEDGVSAISFTRVEGRDLVVTSGMGPIQVHDPVTGERVRELGWYAMTTCIATVGDDQVFLVAANTRGAIDLIDCSTGKVARTIRGHTDTVISLAVGSVGGRDVVVSGSLDSMVRIHDLGLTAAPGTPRIGHQTKVDAVAVALIDGRSTVLSAGDGVRMFDADTGRPVGSPLSGVRSHMSITAGRVSGRDVIVCGGFGGALQVFDAVTREEIGDWSDENWYCVTALALGIVDGRDVLAVGANDGSVRLLNALTGHQICQIFSSAREVAIGRAEKHNFVAVVGNDFTCRVFDATTGKQLSDLSEAAGPVWAVATGSLQGRDIVVTAREDGQVLLVDPLTGVAVEELMQHDGEVFHVAATYIGNELVVVTGGHDATVQATGVQEDDVFVIDVVDVVNDLAAGQDGRIFVASGTSIFSLVPAGGFRRGCRHCD
ncbi:hypothetical protein [Micromonospora sp. NBC_00860]|uniref:WD40 repeat domain-containing protein n=1 Tax=Micromonospora sp. NBC_00860 TaxID=2975980 RepID=UPI003868CEF5|nr:AAA family ATPase [Micromonospora sp. NBC_00860]